MELFYECIIRLQIQIAECSIGLKSCIDMNTSRKCILICIYVCIFAPSPKPFVKSSAVLIDQRKFHLFGYWGTQFLQFIARSYIGVHFRINLRPRLNRSSIICCTRSKWAIRGGGSQNETFQNWTPSMAAVRRVIKFHYSKN